MSIYTLPEGLPIPVDDGAVDHLPGMAVPELTLDSSQGRVDLRELGAELAVLYLYPRTGRPDRPTPDAWNAIPGARGCTPQSCAFRDHAAELGGLGARVAGLSVQALAEQEEFARREHMPFPVIADPDRRLGAALRLPTFEYEGMELYKRVTLILEDGHVTKVFYPVFPPDRNASDVVGWLTERKDAAHGR
jgi:peroxiredoxin